MFNVWFKLDFGFRKKVVFLSILRRITSQFLFHFHPTSLLQYISLANSSFQYSVLSGAQAVHSSCFYFSFGHFLTFLFAFLSFISLFFFKITFLNFLLSALSHPHPPSAIRSYPVPVLQRPPRTLAVCQRKFNLPFLNFNELDEMDLHWGSPSNIDDNCLISFAVMRCVISAGNIYPHGFRLLWTWTISRRLSLYPLFFYGVRPALSKCFFEKQFMIWFMHRWIQFLAN